MPHSVLVREASACTMWKLTQLDSAQRARDLGALGPNRNVINSFPLLKAQELCRREMGR